MALPFPGWDTNTFDVLTSAKIDQLGDNDDYLAGFVDRSGMAVQCKSTSSTAVTTGTTVIPFDDTIPQNTEGDQYITQAITPTNASNILLITAVLQVSSSTARYMTAALFQDSTVNAIAATAGFCTVGTSPLQIVLYHTMAAGTTSSTTFKIRVGGDGAGTTTFNGTNATRNFGAITKSTMSVAEYKV